MLVSRSVVRGSPVRAAAGPGVVRVHGNGRVGCRVAEVAGTTVMTVAATGGPGAGPHRRSVTAVPAVDVVVPAYRRPTLLAQCLEALATQTVAPGESRRRAPPRRRRVSGGTRAATAAGIVEAVAEDPGVLAALHRVSPGPRRASSAITDDDARPRADWLERIVAAFADPGVGAVGGRIELGLPPRPGVVVGDVNWVGRLVGRPISRGCGATRQVDVVAGANSAFRAEALWLPVSGVLRGDGAEPHHEVLLDAWVRADGASCAVRSRDRRRPPTRLDLLPDDDLAAPRESHGMDVRGRPQLGRGSDGARRTTVSRVLAYGLGVGIRGSPGLARATVAVAAPRMGRRAPAARVDPGPAGGCAGPRGGARRARRERRRAPRSASRHGRRRHRTMSERLARAARVTAALVSTYQRKLEEITHREIDLTVVVPRHWRDPAGRNSSSASTWTARAGGGSRVIANGTTTCTRTRDSLGG